MPLLVGNAIGLCTATRSPSAQSVDDLPARIRFHDLRHTNATQLLASGIHSKIARERLGHSGIAITLNLDSDVLPGMQDDAAAKVDAAMRAAIDKVAG